MTDLNTQMTTEAMMQAQIERLTAENERLTLERDDALAGPWPEWASSILSTLKEFGWTFDDLIDLPAEVSDFLREYPDSAVKGLMERIDDLTCELAEHCAQTDALVAAAIERDGGTHDEDCKAMLDREPCICTCGRDELMAAISTYRDSNQAEGAR